MSHADSTSGSSAAPAPEVRVVPGAAGRGQAPSKTGRGKGTRKPNIEAMAHAATKHEKASVNERAKSKDGGEQASKTKAGGSTHAEGSRGGNQAVHAMGRGTFESAELRALPVLTKVTALEPTRVIAHGQRAGIDARVWVGDCRDVLRTLPEIREGELDMVFADPPFNWNRAYDKWNDAMDDREYLDFTRDWLDLCVVGLRGGGQIWVNIPDDWAAEIVLHLKARKLVMNNWCVWHYRFGQNTTARFINSKVHALNFVKPGERVTWNPHEVLEISDRAAIYGDKRTLSKEDGMPPGQRVPMDVWYGPFMGRVQGNNKERRGYHDNQLPEAYLERVIRSTTNPGDLVLDPFLGSGTTGVMALALGRRFIGTEFSKENAKRACERIALGPVRPVQEKPVAQSTAIFKKRMDLKEE